MSYRERRIVLQNNTPSSCFMAKKLVEKGYKVMLKLTEAEEAVVFPL